KTEQSPKKLVMRPPGTHRPAERTSGRNLNHNVQASLPDASGTRLTCRQTLNYARGTGEPKRARRDHCADDSVTATLDPADAPELVRRGCRGRATAHRKPERTPMENQAVPTVLVRGRAFVPFQAPHSLSRIAARCPVSSEARVLDADVRYCQAAAPADPALF